ncbi:hypothetical protein HZS_7675 [Henneguya salminicola]|nr:hypothetical protein HZS_7675 [Henneguya salminicola]
MSLDKLENITVRLEKIADKLESTNLRGSKEDGCNSAMVDAFNPVFIHMILEGPVAEFMQISSKLGSEVEQASKLLKDCYIATANLIKLVAISKKPTDAKIVEILKPLSICVEQVKNFQSKSFKSPEKSHIEAIGGYISAFAWVQSPGKPQNYIGESIDSGQFYANRVLTTFKDKYLISHNC